MILRYVQEVQLRPAAIESFTSLGIHSTLQLTTMQQLIDAGNSMPSFSCSVVKTSHSRMFHSEIQIVEGSVCLTADSIHDHVEGGWGVSHVYITMT